MRIASLPDERTMGKESRNMESRPQHQAPDKQTSGKTQKRWEDEVNDFLKPEETEETKGNEITGKVAKSRKMESNGK